MCYVVAVLICAYTCISMKVAFVYYVMVFLLMCVYMYMHEGNVCILEACCDVGASDSVIELFRYVKACYLV